MRKHHVQILPGTDLGAPLMYPGESLLEELKIFVDEMGMTPREALESATTLPAHWFNIQDQLGTIAVGKLADAALLDANPLDCPRSRGQRQTLRSRKTRAPRGTHRKSLA